MEQREERQVLLELSRVVTEVDRRSSLVGVDASFGSFLRAEEREHPCRVKPCKSPLAGGHEPHYLMRFVTVAIMVTMVANEVAIPVIVERVSCGVVVRLGTIISQPGSTLPLLALDTIPLA